MSRKIVIPHDVIQKLYAELGTVKKVADAIGSSEEPARRLLHEAGVKPIMGGRLKFDPDQEVLRKQYQEMSLRAISQLYGVGETTVWAKVKAFGIEFEGNQERNGKKRKRPEWTEAHRQNMSKSRTGKYRGENGGNWQGGKARENMLLRQSRAYKVWQQEALKLRGNVCQDCGAAGGDVCECCGTVVKLHVHHVYSFAKFPDIRFDPQNSEVLCPKCHYSRHRCKSGELLETP